MTTTDHAALIAAAEARAAAAHAEVADLREKLAAEQAARTDAATGYVPGESLEDRGLTGKPVQETAEDAIAEARKRGGGRTRTEQLAEMGQTTPSALGYSTAADGVAAARARIRHRRLA